MNVRQLITNLTSPQLTKLAENTSVKIKQLKDKYIFQSKTMQELFTDVFEYKGNEKNIIYLKNRTTGKPTPIIVKVTNQTYLNNPNYIVEDIDFINPKTKQTIAHKHYYIKTLKDKKIMYQGEMATYSTEIAGAGIRMDQIQIARAIDEGIDFIPRTSYPQSLIYHIKMGFLPTENSLKVFSLKEAKNYLKNFYKTHNKYLDKKYFEPLIFRNNNEFFIDKDWVMTKAYIDKCQEILDKSKQYRIDNFDHFYILLKLKEEELEKWKKLLERFPILDKISITKNV